MSEPADAIAKLDAVALDVLQDGAELLVRHDRKYLVPSADLLAALATLGGDLAVLDIGGRRAFRYETVYFDTPDMSFHRDGAHRRPVRAKVRTRHYVDTGRCVLEVKMRGRDGRTHKSQRDHDPAAMRTLGASDVAYVARHLRDLPRRTMAGDHASDWDLAPVLSTAYERSTLLHRPTSTRLTVDVGLRWELLAPPGGTSELADLAVVETKSAGRETVVDRALWAVGARPQSFSKHGVGMAALDPSLPSSPWARVLRRHVVTADPAAAAT